MTTTMAPAKQRFVEAADAIGNRLVRDAVWCGNRCNWLIWTKEHAHGAFQPVYRAAPGNFYLGTAGIAFFLAHLARATDDRQHRDVAVGAAKQLAEALPRFGRHETGLYTGSIGAAMTLVHIGAMLDDLASIRTGLDFCGDLTNRPDENSELDLLSGKAGAILALTFLGEQYERPQLLDHAVKLAHALLENSQVQYGRSWPSSSPQSANLLGLSHGTTGMALALLELNLRRPEQCLIQAVQEALFYERAMFDRGQSNWPDFRLIPGSPVTAPSFPCAWCHGSTGMGLARLRMQELMPGEPLLLAEIDVAMQNAVRSANAPITPYATDFTLCHGLFGQAELLLMAGLRFCRNDAIASAERIGDVSIEVIARPRLPWVAGTPDCGETLSLMTGNAGIGYFFLRLADPDLHPSVLLPSSSMA
jgi:lantibiotic modifying enzyme